jgi:CBS domain-containing protein
MQIEDILEEPLVISADSNVARAVSKMIQHGSHEALVMQGEEFQGVLSAADLARTNITNPEKMGIKSFVKQMNPMHVAAEPAEILNMILVNECRAVPVEKDGKLFVVSKLSLLKFFRDKMALKGKIANDVMSFPLCISPDDSISTARALMRDANACRIAVVGENDKVEGVLDTLDLLKTIIGKERSTRGEENGEKIRLDELPVKSIASKDVIRIAPETTVRDTMDRMIASSAFSLIVEREGMLAGMVTTIDILKLASTPVEGVHITVSGIHEEDNFIKSAVNGEIERSVKKLGKIVPLSYFVMHVRKYSKEGKRIKYSVHARLITDRGNFFAQDYAWDLAEATKGVMNKIEKEVIKKAEKANPFRKG